MLTFKSITNKIKYIYNRPCAKMQECVRHKRKNPEIIRLDGRGLKEVKGHWPKVNVGEGAGGGNPLLLGGSGEENFKIRCSVVNSGTLWSQNKMFKIRTLRRRKIKILTFSKTKYISDWEEWGVNLQGYLTATLQTA